MVSKSIFKSSNIVIQPLVSSFLVTKKDLSKSYHKTISISHGSGGLTSTELRIADFFIEHGFEVEVFDHFLPLRISKLNWGFSEGLVDEYKVSLLDLIETIDDNQCMSYYHLGLSLGGYIGLNNAHVFKKVFCCYPGILPIIKDRFLDNCEKIHIYEGTNDAWTQLPLSLKKFLPDKNFKRIVGAYHSFMSKEKDKECLVYKYDFSEPLVDYDKLAKIQLNHHSISQFGNSQKIVSRNKSDDDGFKIVLGDILKEVQYG